MVFRSLEGKKILELTSGFQQIPCITILLSALYE